MWEKPRAVDQFVEQVHDGSPFWTAAAADYFTVTTTKLDQVLASDDRFDHQHAMVDEEFVEFVADGSDAAQLNFHQDSATDDVDPIVVQGDFLAGSSIRIELF